MSDLRKMARDAGFNTEFDDYVIDHWQRFEKFARLINAAALAQPEPIWVQGKPTRYVARDPIPPQRKPLRTVIYACPICAASLERQE